MYDHVVVLDEELRCPNNHRVDDFQTKSFDEPSLDTYLFDARGRAGRRHDRAGTRYQRTPNSAHSASLSTRSRRWSRALGEITSMAMLGGTGL
jgi:hypothetical protein